MSDVRVATAYLHLPRAQLIDSMLSDYRATASPTDALEFQKFCAAIAIVIDSGYFQVIESMRSSAWDAFVCREQSDKLAAFTKYLRLLLQLVHKAQFEPLPQEAYTENVNQTSYLHALNVRTDLDVLRKNTVDVFALETFFRTHHFWANVDQCQVPIPEYGTTLLIYTRGTGEITQKGFFLWEKLNYIASCVTSLSFFPKVGGGSNNKKVTPPSSPTQQLSPSPSSPDCMFQPTQKAHQQLRDVMKRKGFFLSLITNLEVQHTTFLEVLVMSVKKASAESNKAALQNLVQCELYANIPCRDLSMVLPDPIIVLPPLDRLIFCSSVATLAMACYTTYLSYIDEKDDVQEVSHWTTMFLYASVAIACVVKIAMTCHSYIMSVHYYSREVMKWRGERLVSQGTSLLSHLHHEVREQEVKEALLCYYTMLSKDTSTNTQTHFSSHQIDTNVERFLCDVFGVEFNFDVVDALEKLVSLGLVSLEAGKGYRVSCKPQAYLDTAHPRWIEFFHSFLRVPPPPAT